MVASTGMIDNLIEMSIRKGRGSHSWQLPFTVESLTTISSTRLKFSSYSFARHNTTADVSKSHIDVPQRWTSGMENCSTSQTYDKYKSRGSSISRPRRGIAHFNEELLRPNSYHLAFQAIIKI